MKKLIFVLLFSILNYPLFSDSNRILSGGGIETELIFVNQSDQPIQFEVVFDSLVELDQYGEFSDFFVNLDSNEVWSCTIINDSEEIKLQFVNIDMLMHMGFVVINVKFNENIISTQINIPVKLESKNNGNINRFMDHRGSRGSFKP